MSLQHSNVCICMYVCMRVCMWDRNRHRPLYSCQAPNLFQIFAEIAVSCLRLHNTIIQIFHVFPPSVIDQLYLPLACRSWETNPVPTGVDTGVVLSEGSSHSAVRLVKLVRSQPRFAQPRSMSSGLNKRIHKFTFIFTVHIFTIDYLYQQMH
jgi:hypothetical protein